MILYLQIEKIGNHLNALSPLMDKYQHGDASFPDGALKWLEEAEKTLGMLRLPEGSEMSVLRGRIVKAAEISTISEGHVRRSVIRRARNVAAAEALEQAEATLRKRLLTAEERLKFFEEKLCEGLTAMMLQIPLPEKSKSHTEWLNQVWIQLRQQQSTRPLSLYITSSLSPFDRSIILDRVCSRVIDEGIAHHPNE